MKTIEELAPEWEGDYLNRIDEGRYLIKYLNALYGDSSDEILHGSFVLNLNAPWGYGKTYFLKELHKDLTELGHPVIYFDSWGNDYSNTPLLSFISEVQTALKPFVAKTTKGKALLEVFNEKSKQIIGAVAGIGASIIAKKLTGYSLTELKELLDLSDDDLAKIKDKVGDNSEKIVGEIIQKSIDEHQQLKHLISDFKDTLEQLMVSLNEEKEYKFPMYILVDELDRCRPDFAVQLLENIKHIFNSKGVFFIVATNKTELVNSIKAIYGNNFDSFNYLKRFFNQEYNLSLPNTYGYATALFKRYRISGQKLENPFKVDINKAEDINALVFSKLSTALGLGLRDKEQICIQLKSILLTIGPEKLHFPFLIYLLIVKHKHSEGDLNELIKKSTGNLNNTFMLVPQFAEYGERKQPELVSFNTILNLYIRVLSSTKKQLYEIQSSQNQKQYEQVVIQQLVHMAGNNIPYSTLHDYYNMVEKAGHFGIGATAGEFS